MSGKAADGKVLKLESGSLAWGDDIVGSSGSSYTADGSSLSLSGTTFSVKDGGIGPSKLANGSVTLGKLDEHVVDGANLRLPLAVADGTSDPLVSLKNIVGDGLYAESAAGGVGVYGKANLSAGVYGLSRSSAGVDGRSSTNIGVRGFGEGGVQGFGNSGPGVQGNSKTGYGVYGVAQGDSSGVFGESTSGPGVVGTSVSNYGVNGTSTNGTGVLGSGGSMGVSGFSANGSAVYGRSTAGYAAEFQGGKFGQGVCYFAGGSGWSCTSDRNAKENFRAVDTQAVLEALAKLPITRWNMKGDPSKTPHMGPVAQDFKAAFGLGESDKTISTSDAQGVALAAIQGLYQKNQALEAKVAALEAKLERK